MRAIGVMLILLGIGAIGLGFGSNSSVGMMELGCGFALLTLGCVLVGIDRIYEAVRSSRAAEIKALQEGFELLAKRLEPQREPDHASSLPSWSPRMPPDWRQGAGA